jgi:putative SOS response-associated peptidase YedK
VEHYTLTEAARFDIARGQLAPVELRDGVHDVRWGLLAPWQGHGGKRAPNIYEAALDAIDTTPILRNARAKRRCLVRADGWFGSRKLGSKRQPYWVHAPERIAFAGLVATHADDGIASFAIVMVPAAGIAAPFATAMPAVVDERWLDSAEIVALALTGWRADAVATIGSVTPLGNPSQGELF